MAGWRESMLRVVTNSESKDARVVAWMKGLSKPQRDELTAMVLTWSVWVLDRWLEPLDQALHQLTRCVVIKKK